MPRAKRDRPGPFPQPAPRLISRKALSLLKPGSVVVDLAAEAGGNCEGTVPGERVTTDNGVTILGEDLLSRAPGLASTLFSSNVSKFLLSMGPFTGAPGVLAFDDKDPAVRGALVLRRGAPTWPPPPGLVPAPAPPAPKKEPPPKPARDPAAAARSGAAATTAAVGAALAAGALAPTEPAFAAATTFGLASVCGYQTVWGVAPALHSPLMSVTNAISGGRRGGVDGEAERGLARTRAKNPDPNPLLVQACAPSAPCTTSAAASCRRPRRKGWPRSLWPRALSTLAADFTSPGPCSPSSAAPATRPTMWGITQCRPGSSSPAHGRGRPLACLVSPPRHTSPRPSSASPLSHAWPARTPPGWATRWVWRAWRGVWQRRRGRWRSTWRPRCSWQGCWRPAAAPASPSRAAWRPRTCPRRWPVFTLSSVARPCSRRRPPLSRAAPPTPFTPLPRSREPLSAPSRSPGRRSRTASWRGICRARRLRSREKTRSTSALLD